MPDQRYSSDTSWKYQGATPGDRGTEGTSVASHSCSSNGGAPESVSGATTGHSSHRVYPSSAMHQHPSSAVNQYPNALQFGQNDFDDSKATLPVDPTAFFPSDQPQTSVARRTTECSAASQGQRCATTYFARPDFSSHAERNDKQQYGAQEPFSNRQGLTQRQTHQDHFFPPQNTRQQGYGAQQPGAALQQESAFQGPVQYSEQRLATEQGRSFPSETAAYHSASYGEGAPPKARQDHVFLPQNARQQGYGAQQPGVALQQESAFQGPVQYSEQRLATEQGRSFPSETAAYHSASYGEGAPPKARQDHVFLPQNARQQGYGAQQPGVALQQVSAFQGPVQYSEQRLATEQGRSFPSETAAHQSASYGEVAPLEARQDHVFPSQYARQQGYGAQQPGAGLQQESAFQGPVQYSEQRLATEQGRSFPSETAAHHSASYGEVAPPEPHLDHFFPPHKALQQESAFQGPVQYSEQRLATEQGRSFPSETAAHQSASYGEVAPLEAHRGHFFPPQNARQQGYGAQQPGAALQQESAFQGPVQYSEQRLATEQGRSFPSETAAHHSASYAEVAPPEPTSQGHISRPQNTAQQLGSAVRVSRPGSEALPASQRIPSSRPDDAARQPESWSYPLQTDLTQSQAFAPLSGDNMDVVSETDELEDEVLVSTSHANVQAIPTSSMPQPAAARSVARTGVQPGGPARTQQSLGKARDASCQYPKYKPTLSDHRTSATNKTTSSQRRKIAQKELESGEKRVITAARNPLTMLALESGVVLPEIDNKLFLDYSQQALTLASAIYPDAPIIILNDINRLYLEGTTWAAVETILNAAWEKVPALYPIHQVEDLVATTALDAEKALEFNLFMLTIDQLALDNLPHTLHEFGLTQLPDGYTIDFMNFTRQDTTVQGKRVRGFWNHQCIRDVILESLFGTKPKPLVGSGNAYRFENRHLLGMFPIASAAIFFVLRNYVRRTATTPQEVRAALVPIIKAFRQAFKLAQDPQHYPHGKAFLLETAHEWWSYACSIYPISGAQHAFQLQQASDFTRGNYSQDDDSSSIATVTDQQRLVADASTSASGGEFQHLCFDEPD